jgi:O-antigen ligase
MYTHTLKLIKKHPFFGGGTGSIEGEYTELIRDEKDIYIKKVTNPHNQYLMTTQELGVFGLLMLFAFFGVHWWQSYKLEKEHGHFLRALIISTSLGSLFNSLLLDSGDGRMYCILAGVLLSGYSAKARLSGVLKSN